MWVATSHSYDSFIHYTSPVYPAHQQMQHGSQSVIKTGRHSWCSPSRRSHNHYS
jgi:hypothetical protein